MQLLILQNKKNFARVVGSEKVRDSGRDYQILEGVTREGALYYVAFLYSRDGSMILACRIFATLEEAQKDVGM